MARTVLAVGCDVFDPFDQGDGFAQTLCGTRDRLEALIRECDREDGGVSAPTSCFA